MSARSEPTIWRIKAPEDTNPWYRLHEPTWTRREGWEIEEVSAASVSLGTLINTIDSHYEGENYHDRVGLAASIADTAIDVFGKGAGKKLLLAALRDGWI